MAWSDLALHGAVALAALVQAVTGLGFALVAGPALLLLMDSSGAMPVTAGLCLLVATLLVPVVGREVDGRALARICLGGILGLPVGLALLLLAETWALKLGAGLTLALVLAGMLWRAAAGAPRPISWRQGVLPGVLGGALAMPGPLVALSLGAAGAGKARIRATLTLFFLPAYSSILLAQAAVGAVDGASLALMLRLAPAVVAGTLGGVLIAPLISETRFRQVVLAGIGVIAAVLLADGSATLLGGRA